MGGLFLTRDEVYELTGYKLQKKQCDWLTARSWVFAVPANGYPIISRTYAEQKLGCTPAPDTKPAIAPKMNLDAVKKHRK